MGSDNKPIHILFDKGMSQELDEFAVPVPGNIRHAINTRTRRGGSIEQRRGVHGFVRFVPSYMANFRATGSAVEFVGRIGDSPAFGMDGRAYAHDRRSQIAFYAGEYSQYEPLSRETAILTERQHGLFGNRHVAIGRDIEGNKFTAMASMSDTDVECRVENSSGQTVASFTINSTEAVAVDLVGAEDSPFIYVVVLVALGSGGAGSRITRLYKIHLGPSVFYTEHFLNDTGQTSSIARSVPPGAIVFSPTMPDLATLRLASSATGAHALVEYRRAETFLEFARVPFEIGGSGPDAFVSGNFAVGRSPQSYTVVGMANQLTSSNRRGNVTFHAIGHTSLGAGDEDTKVLATGILIPSGVNYSAPILAPTSDPQRFLWAASNGITTFGELLIPSGPARVRTIATMMGTPLSDIDSSGSIWMMTDNLNFAPVPRAGRAVLVRHPGTVPSLAAYAKPMVQLAAERQFPNPSNESFVWDSSQTQYSKVAEDGDARSVLLPLQLRSQGSGLFSLEKYTYRHTPSSEKSRQVLPLKSATIVAGQPGEIYKSPNRAGIGVITGAPTFAARPQLASEVGFATEPYIATLAQASGSRIAPGTRLYSAIFEWLAPSGERHRSRPATPRSFVNTTPAGVMPYVPEEFLSQRFPSPRVHYYRTIDGRKEFRRISPDTGVEPGTQFYDHNSDDEIRDNEILYTDGGVQPNDLAPSCRFMALGEDRLWVGGLFESDIIQASKKFVPREPVRFTDHDAFKVRLPYPNTGLAYLDGGLVAFCEDSCYLITGDGPNDKGAGSFALRPIADVGALDQRSILVTSIGVFFQSRRSLQLMPRGFGPPEQIRNLNELMGEFGDGFTEVIGAALAEYSDEETARFLLRNPETNERIVAVLELGTKTWSYDVIRRGDGSQSPLCAISEGPEGVLYGAGSGTHRIMTELKGVGGTPYDSMGSTIDRFWSEVRLGRFQAFGPAGEGKLKAMQLRGYSPATGAQVNLSVVSDYGTLTHTYSGIGSGTFFRRSAAGPFDASASEAQVSAVFRTGVGQKHGLRLLSLTLELEPTQGLRRARIGEQD